MTDLTPPFPETYYAHPFTCETKDGGSWFCPGMTLRDWFAGQALAGILANPNIHKEANALGVPCVNIAVPAAYVAADAMLEARK